MTVTIGARGWRSGRIVLLEQDFLGRLGDLPVAVSSATPAAAASVSATS